MQALGHRNLRNSHSLQLSGSSRQACSIPPAARRRPQRNGGRCMAKAKEAVNTEEEDTTRELNKNLETVKQLKRTRLITALKTPYLKTGEFDLPTLNQFVRNQIANGVEGIIVGGTTGEGQLMSWEEHVQLILHCVQKFGDQIRIIGNTGSNSTREAEHATRWGFKVGMDASLQINPYYGKTSAAGMIDHFETCLDLGPGIVYNVPARTAQDIPDDVIDKLAQHQYFVGVKECTGNDRIQNYTERGIASWSGNDDEAHDARHKHGAVGVISVTSNVVPGLFAELMAAPNDELNASLQELIGWMFQEPNPISVNTALAMCGLVKPVFRLPYAPLSAEQRAAGVKLLTPLLADIPGAQHVQQLEGNSFTVVRPGLQIF